MAIATAEFFRRPHAAGRRPMTARDCDNSRNHGSEIRREWDQKIVFGRACIWPLYRDCLGERESLQGAETFPSRKTGQSVRRQNSTRSRLTAAQEHSIDQRLSLLKALFPLGGTYGQGR